MLFSGLGTIYIILKHTSTVHIFISKLILQKTEIWTHRHIYVPVYLCLWIGMQVFLAISTPRAVWIHEYLFNKLLQKYNDILGGILVTFQNHGLLVLEVSLRKLPGWPLDCRFNFIQWVCSEALGCSRAWDRVKYRVCVQWRKKKNTWHKDCLCRGRDIWGHRNRSKGDVHGFILAQQRECGFTCLHVVWKSKLSLRYHSSGLVQYSFWDGDFMVTRGLSVWLD